MLKGAHTIVHQNVDAHLSNQCICARPCRDLEGERISTANVEVAGEVAAALELAGEILQRRVRAPTINEHNVLVWVGVKSLNKHRSRKRIVNEGGKG